MKNIIGYSARIIFVVGLMLFIPAIIGIIYAENQCAFHFIWLAAMVSAVGFSVSFSVGRRFVLTEPSLLEAMVISAVAWLFVSLIGAFPYIYIIDMPPLDAYFEAMAGFTTTGMTLISDVENVPRSLLFWRAFTQWVGGVGVILLFILFLRAGGLGLGVWRLYRAEAREDRLAATIKASVKRIWLIYAFFTALCTVLLWFFGFNIFDALTHSFTTLSTGGFSTRNLSIAAFQNPAAETVIVIFMILGATTFTVHMNVFRGKLSTFLSIEMKFTLIVTTLFSIFIALQLAMQNFYDGLQALRLSIFQSVSILTTTGYTTTDVISLPSLSKVLLMALMFVGGNVGSTGGALKAMRIIILLGLTYHTLARIILPPGTIKPFKIGGLTLSEEETTRITGFFVAYLFVILVAGIILTLYGSEPFAAFSAVASAQGNVGPCFLSINTLQSVPKAILILLMWAGRLEIIPVLVLLSPASWREFARLRKRHG